MTLRIQATGGNATARRRSRTLAFAFYLVACGMWVSCAETTAAWTTGGVLAFAVGVGWLIDSFAALRARSAREAYGVPELELACDGIESGGPVRARIEIPVARGIDAPMPHAELLSIRQRMEVWGSASRGSRSFVSRCEPVDLSVAPDTGHGTLVLEGVLEIPDGSSALTDGTLHQLALRVDADDAPTLTARFVLPSSEPPLEGESPADRNRS